MTAPITRGSVNPIPLEVLERLRVVKPWLFVCRECGAAKPSPGHRCAACWAIIHRRQHLRARARKFRSAAFRYGYAKVLRGDPCSYCGGPGGTIDHIVPMKAGEKSHVGNATGACRRCNHAKGDKPLFVFLAEIWRRR